MGNGYTQKRALAPVALVAVATLVGCEPSHPLGRYKGDFVEIHFKGSSEQFDAWGCVTDVTRDGITLGNVLDGGYKPNHQFVAMTEIGDVVSKGSCKQGIRYFFGPDTAAQVP